MTRDTMPALHRSGSGSAGNSLGMPMWMKLMAIAPTIDHPGVGKVDYTFRVQALVGWT